MFRDAHYAGGWPELVSRIDTQHVVQRWAQADPDLAGLDTVADLIARWRADETKYQVLRALIRFAAADAQCDDDALLLLLHLFSSLVFRLARELGDLGEDVAEVVVAEMAAVLRRYRIDTWRGAVVQTVYRQTRRAVLAELRPSNRYHPEYVPVPVPDRVIRAKLDRDSYTRWNVSSLDLPDVLAWASGQGLDGEALALLLDSERERDHYRSGADGRVAALRGVTRRTLLRRRQRVLAELRRLAPVYLADVA
jgi:hypothetical protein